MKKLSFVIIFVITVTGYAQNPVSLEAYLNQLDSTTEYTFFYKKDWIDSLFVDASREQQPVVNVKKAIANSGLLVHVYKEKFIFIYPNKIELERQEMLNSRSTLYTSVESVRIGNPDIMNENEESVLSGVTTKDTDEFIVGANILIDGNLVTTSGPGGKYEVNLKPGVYEMEFSYIGLETEKRMITFYSDGSLDMVLFSDSRLLDEVVVDGSSFEESTGLAQVGVQKLGVAKLEKLPSFMGDVDVVKSATVLPGVSVSGESSSYLNVRGGGNDQTLVLMNNTTIYNPGHMLGFFSVFNGDFVSDMTLYKGNIPARYGMRSSSVLDVKMNKLATDKVNINGGLGIANSNIGVKTKLLDDKLDIHTGGRISYVNWMLDLVPDIQIVTSSIRFGDFNFSSRYRINDKNTLYASTYYGSDVFNYAGLVSYRWQTFNNQIKWVHAINNDWLLESEFSMSSLNNETENLQPADQYLLENGIRDFTFKSSISSDVWEFGLDFTKYNIEGGSISPTSSDTPLIPSSVENEDLLNLAAHASYLIKLDNGIEINPGVRFNYFLNFGPESINIYESDAPYLTQNIIGQEEVGSGEVAHSQATFEPRLGINYKRGQSTFRAGYSRINQFLHLIANTVLINPSTVWKGSDRYIPHTQIDQYSLGYQYNFPKDDISISVDGFYKSLTDMIDYRDGAVLVLNDDLEQDILRGVGNIYGFEVLLSKNEGNLTGLMSYTYSRSFIEVNDPIQGVEINGGEKYPFYSDRPHSFKSSIDYKLSRKWTISSNFTFVSGAPISSPLAVFEIDNQSIPFFTERNAARIPDYHRLDLVLTLKSRIRKTKRNNDRWVLTLYNVYGRDNVATIYFSSQNNLPGQPFQLVNVDRMIPTLTYKFEF